MKDTVPEELEQGRITTGPMASYSTYGFNGAFFVRYKKAWLKIIISDEMGWDHVSVSLKHRCPFWHEMCFVKDLCFKPDEWVLQYHPAESDYINDHPYCLHLWKPQNVDIPTPPKIFVGIGDAK